MSDSEELTRVVDKILEKNNDRLKSLIETVVQNIAGKFLAVGLIDRKVDDSMRVVGIQDSTHAANLLSKCTATLLENPGENFPKFIKVLKGYRILERLASEMELEFGQATLSSYPGPAASVPRHPSHSLALKTPGVPKVPKIQEGQDSPDFGGLPKGHPPVLLQDGGITKRLYNVTTRKSHALALILNNDTFHRQDLEDLPSSDQDVSRLQKVLEHTLGFKVVTKTNLEAEEITQLFESKIERRIKKDHDSFFCCIMSHGERNKIYGSDGNLVSITKLMEFLEGEKCKELIGKPKIIIIDCCRGSRTPSAVSKGPSTQNMISPRSDFIFGYSTVRGDTALIDDWRGSLYIEKLCEVMEKNDRSLNEMLCIVNQKLQEFGPQPVDDDNFVQTGQVEHTLREFVFFHPPE